MSGRTSWFHGTTAVVVKLRDTFIITSWGSGQAGKCERLLRSHLRFYYSQQPKLIKRPTVARSGRHWHWLALATGESILIAIAKKHTHYLVYQAYQLGWWSIGGGRRHIVVMIGKFLAPAVCSLRARAESTTKIETKESSLAWCFRRTVKKKTFCHQTCVLYDAWNYIKFKVRTDKMVDDWLISDQTHTLLYYLYRPSSVYW